MVDEWGRDWLSKPVFAPGEAYNPRKDGWRVSNALRAAKPSSRTLWQHRLHDMYGLARERLARERGWGKGPWEAAAEAGEAAGAGGEGKKRRRSLAGERGEQQREGGALSVGADGGGPGG